jgi:hypothetical protein
MNTLLSKNINQIISDENYFSIFIFLILKKKIFINFNYFEIIFQLRYWIII